MEAGPAARPPPAGRGDPRSDPADAEPVTRRLGHGVEALVSIYVGALDGDDLAANKLIDAAMTEARAWMRGDPAG